MISHNIQDRLKVLKLHLDSIDFRAHQSKVCVGIADGSGYRWIGRVDRSSDICEALELALEDALNQFDPNWKRHFP
ncbi:MAG: hypothetical protein ABI430_01280 [Candidatus Taylorbacteria bacterium]